MLKNIFVFGTLALIAACKGGEIYPIIPSIEFESSYVIKSRNGGDSLVGIVMKYRDGDGDIGLQQGDTLPPFNVIPEPGVPGGENINFYYYNLYIYYLEKHGDEYKHVLADFTGDTLIKKIRVMNITPEGKFKAIRGTIETQFEPSILENRADTIKVRFFLIDRALHVSNTAESRDIILTQ